MKKITRRYMLDCSKRQESACSSIAVTMMRMIGVQGHKAALKWAEVAVLDFIMAPVPYFDHLPSNPSTRWSIVMTPIALK